MVVEIIDLSRFISIKIDKYSEYEIHLKKTSNPNFKGGICSTMDEVLFVNKVNYKSFTYRVLSENLYSFNNEIYFREKLAHH